jgi:hypothetical protein
MASGPMAKVLRRVGAAAISDLDVAKDPARAVLIAQDAMRAALEARRKR